MIYDKYLFDLDGVLVDTKYIQYNSTKTAILNSVNYDISSNSDINNVFKSTITTKNKLKYLVDKNIIKECSINDIYLNKKVIADNIFRDLDIDPEKVNLFKFLKDKKCNIAVVTNGNKKSAKIILQSIGLIDYIDLLVTNDDVINTKPHSEPYIKAMIKFGGNIKNYIIFEDSEVGLISARGTGSYVYEVNNYKNVNINLIKSLNNIKDINIIIPMAGLGHRFSKRGFKTQKPLIKINNKTLIEYAINSLDINGNYIFIIRKDNDKQYMELINLLKKLKNNCKIIEIDYITEGSASTCILAKEYINNDNELIITNCDQILEWDSNNFLYNCKKYDCCVLTYKSDSEQNSYIKIENNVGTEIKEKEIISSNALVGVHYFKKGSDFVNSYEEIFKKKIKFKNEYYMSTVCNNFIKNNLRVGIHMLSLNEKYYSTGTPENYFKYLRCKNFLNTKILKIKDMFRGWYVGNFEPSAYKTNDFEAGYLLHKRGEIWDVHYHAHMKEINLLVKGKMILNDIEINEGDIFIIDKFEIACPIFLEDCYIFVLKVPSVVGDKIII